jgi:hypothetical protein
VAAELGACRHAREREGEHPGRERRESRASWRSLTAPGGLLGGMGGKQEVAGDGQRASMQLLGKKTRGICKKPLALGCFPRNFKT